MTTPPNKSTGDDVSIINLSPFRYVFTHMGGETRTYVTEQDYLAAEASAEHFRQSMYEVERVLTERNAELARRDDRINKLQSQVDALTGAREEWKYEAEAATARCERLASENTALRRVIERHVKFHDNACALVRDARLQILQGAYDTKQAMTARMDEWLKRVDGPRISEAIAEQALAADSGEVKP